MAQDLTASGLGFSRPSAVCLDGSGRIYVADTLRSRIVRMDDMSGANNVTQNVAQPQGVCLDTLGRIYVAETALNRIVRMDDMTGANNVSQDLSGEASQLNGPRGVFYR